MNPSAATTAMGDADIHAFGPAPAGSSTATPAASPGAAGRGASAAAPRRRRLWPWLLALALLTLLATLVVVAGVLRELTLLGAPGWDIVVDGESVWPGEEFGLGSLVLAFGGIVIALLVVLVVVPLALLLALFGVALGVGIPLLLLLGVLALLLSPLWLAALLLWLVLRRPRPAG